MLSVRKRQSGLTSGLKNRLDGEDMRIENNSIKLVYFGLKTAMGHPTVSVKPGPVRGSGKQTSLGPVRDVPPRSQETKKAWAHITTPFLIQRSGFTIV